MLTMETPAKINLVLEVIGRRDDGFHEIRSLVRTINLFDSIYMEFADIISLKCKEPALKTTDNLILRAATSLKQYINYTGGVTITLNKRIPLSAGLGGGSSDAAATIIGLNKLWDLHLPHSDLQTLAAQLGSDVPLFLHQGTILVEGKGEKITPLPEATSPQWFVLLVPPLSGLKEKTKKMYAHLNSNHFTQGQYSERALEYWRNNKQLETSLLFNVFDSIVFDMFPMLEVYWRQFEQAGADNIHVAGSGPTLFTLANNDIEAKEISRHLRLSANTKVYTVSSTQ